MSDTSYPIVIDMSSYQGQMEQSDFNYLRTQGVRGVVVKLTQGVDYENPYAKKQLEMAKNANLAIHVYHYLTAQGRDSVIAEANYFLEKYNSLGLNKNEVIAMVDVEDATGAVARYPAQDINYFNQYLINAGIKQVGCYSSRSWFDNTNGYYFIDIAQLFKNTLLWVANIQATQPGINNVDLWQFTWSFCGNYDASYDFFGTFTKQQSYEMTDPAENYPQDLPNKVGHGTVVSGETATSIANELNRKYELGLKNPLATFIANNPDIFINGDPDQLPVGAKYVFYY